MLTPTSAPLWSQGLGPAESGMHILRAPSRRGVQNQKCPEMFRIRREIGSRRRWAFLLINQRVDLFRVLKVWLSEKDGETKRKKRESQDSKQMCEGMLNRGSEPLAAGRPRTWPYALIVRPPSVQQDEHGRQQSAGSQRRQQPNHKLPLRAQSLPPGVIRPVPSLSIPQP
jgi:hypothetical protein